VNVHRRIAVRRVTRAMTSAHPHSAGALFSATSIAISLTAHALATWLALFAPPGSHPAASDDPLVATRFLYPLMQPSPRPVQEQVRFVGMPGPGTAPAPRPAPERAATTAREPAPEVVAAAPPADDPPGAADGIFTEIQVDLAAERDPMSEGPLYPDSLLAHHIEGEARVRFVVDSTGHADPASFGVIETNRSGFADAVREALPRMRFRPASIGEKKVSQHVEQTFVFRITPPPIVP
jgi:protein TonB